MKNEAKKNLLVLMSGSIAAYKVCSVLSQMKQKGFNIKVVMSEAVQKFIGATTIEGLTGEPPIVDMYATGTVMDHIHLTRWADLTLLAPASANTINKFAAGLGDDLLTTLFLASDFSKPFLIAPAMNTKMYFHPATQKSLVTLKEMGCQILDSASGILACGEVGYGRLLEPELIQNAVLDSLNRSAANDKIKYEMPKPSKSVRILITGGGTSEPIDDVRSITNTSTGKTAAALADKLTEFGFEVTGLFAKSAVKPTIASTTKTFDTYADLDQLLSSALESKFDIVIHAAAVSDFSIDRSKLSAEGKISSDKETMTLTLKKNAKLIDKIKAVSPESLLIAFKLTSGATPELVLEKVSKLFQNSKCDFVVHNDLQSMKKGPHMFHLWNANHLKAPSVSHLSLDDLSHELFSLILKNALKGQNANTPGVKL